MFDVFMKITAAKGGELKGISSNTKHAEWIDVLSYSHEMEAPVDLHSGTTSGKVQFRPIKIRKKIDTSTPLIYKALTDNDNLKEVLFEFWTAGSTGGIQKYLDIKLTNGRIVSSAMVMNPSLEGGGSTVKGAAQVGLVTQVIELTYETMSWKYQGFKTDGSTFGGPKEAEVKWGEM